MDDSPILILLHPLTLRQRFDNCYEMTGPDVILLRMWAKFALTK